MSPRNGYEGHSTFFSWRPLPRVLERGHSYSLSWETLAKRTAFSKAGPLFTLSWETVAELAWPSPGAASSSLSLEGEGWGEGGCWPQHFVSGGRPAHHFTPHSSSLAFEGEGSSGQPLLGYRKGLLSERIEVRDS